MSVHVLADAHGKLPVLRAMLEERHAVTSELLNAATPNRVTAAGAGSPNLLDFVGASVPPVTTTTTTAAIRTLRRVFGSRAFIRLLLLRSTRDLDSVVGPVYGMPHAHA